MTVSDVELIIPNESGIITILLDGKERRYMKEKFIEFLIKNKGNKMDLPEFKIPKVKTEKKEFKRRGKEVIKIKGEDMRGRSNCIPIIAVYPNGNEVNYPSSSAASIDLGLTRSDICKVINGHYSEIKKFKFKKNINYER